MVKDKLIQVRLNNLQFNQVIANAESRNQSISEYAREILLQTDISNTEVEQESVNKIPVIERQEFLKAVIWIYSKRDGKGVNSIVEAKYYASLIDSFLMDLKPNYLEYFFNVKKDLNVIIREYSNLFGVKYSFYKSYDNAYFNYVEFEKLLLYDLM